MGEGNSIAATDDVAVETKAVDVASKGPKKLEDIDRLRIENLYLQVQNLGLQAQQMQADLLKATQMRQEAQGKMALLQRELSEKYDIDLSKVKILPDGTILPSGN
jgi:hypothetical protein